MHAAIFKTLPIFSIVTVMTLALAFAPAGPTAVRGPWCPPIC
jgi:hypothetical protein